ncbi:hypothetical protein KA107_01795 [Candidatus Pacearchaeota archaeon]|nr:hypothetical protein [Candidatus Pacearchaeota archaeon]
MDDKKLEESLNSLMNQKEQPLKVEMSGAHAGVSSDEQNEEIGFHKGTISTLLAERNELVKMIGNVEAILQSHLKRLEQLGVKLK